MQNSLQQAKVSCHATHEGLHSAAIWKLIELRGGIGKGSFGIVEPPKNGPYTLSIPTFHSRVNRSRKFMLCTFTRSLLYAIVTCRFPSNQDIDSASSLQNWRACIELLAAPAFMLIFVYLIGWHV